LISVIRVMLLGLFQEIYSSWSHKTEHFQKIHTRTGVPFTAMLFFDDEDRNIKSVKHKLLLERTLHSVD
jgi:magnesium-dependent phosphatase 1